MFLCFWKFMVSEAPLFVPQATPHIMMEICVPAKLLISWPRCKGEARGYNPFRGSHATHSLILSTFLRVHWPGEQLGRLDLVCRSDTDWAEGTPLEEMSL